MKQPLGNVRSAWQHLRVYIETFTENISDLGHSEVPDSDDAHSRRRLVIKWVY